MFFIFLLSSVISLIWSSLLPQWTSQRRLKSSMFSTYDNGFSNFNWKLHKIYKKNFFTLYFFTILSCLLIRLRRLIIIKEELIFLKYQFFCLDFFFVILEIGDNYHLLRSVKKPIQMLFLNKHMKPRKFTLTHSGISSVFFLLRRPLVPLTDPCPEPTKLPSIEDLDDTLGDTEGEFLEGPRLWV